jgi:hypothetical protein
MYIVNFVDYIKLPQAMYIVNFVDYIKLNRTQG